MTLTLNTTSGVLHRSPRCAGQDKRFHYTVLDYDEDVIGVFLRIEGLPLVMVHRCRKCLR